MEKTTELTQPISYEELREAYRDARNTTLANDMWREAGTGRTLRIVGHAMDEERGEARFSYVDLRQPEVVWSMSAEKFLGKITLDDGSEVIYHEPTNYIY